MSTTNRIVAPNAVLLALLLIPLSGCGDDNKGGSHSYSYKLTLSGPSTPEVGALQFSVSDPASLINEGRIKKLYSQEGFPIIRMNSEGSPPDWRFMILKKRGALPLGNLLEFTADGALNTAPVINQLCDVDGDVLNVSDYTLSLEETRR
jgi:hypothetical protein